MFPLCEQTNLQRKPRRAWTEHAQSILSNSFTRSFGRGRGQGCFFSNSFRETWALGNGECPPTLPAAAQWKSQKFFGILILLNCMCSLVFCLWFGGGENLPRFYLCIWLWELWNLPSFILFVRTLDIQILEFCVCVYILFLRKKIMFSYI